MDLEDLIERCIQNDRAAQRQLYLNYKDKLYTIAYRMTGDFDAASDLLQECFIDAFKGMATLKEKKYFFSWIKKILIRKAFTYVKSIVKTEEISNVQGVSTQINTGLDVEYIEQKIQELPPKSRAVFIMREIEGFTHKEIADTLNISVGSSKSQLNYAKNKLKEKLKDFVL